MIPFSCRRGWAALSIAFVVGSTALAQIDHGKKLDEFLSQGQLGNANEYFTAVVAKDSDDSTARVALGFTQFLQAIESLGQSNYRYGLVNQPLRNIPLARMPIPLNSNPEKISYQGLRGIVSDFGERLAIAEQTLAAAKTSSIHIPLFFGKIRLDLNGDGKCDDDESLWRIFTAINTGVQAEQGEGFALGVDGADVHWLRGYCHFLMAFCDVVMAYDESQLFERCAQLLFPNVDSPYLAAQDGAADTDSISPTMVLDGIAAIHLVNFPLIDKDRMASAHSHLLSMIEQSRLCWERAQSEMDDDREWIPNEKQTGVLQVRVSREMITGWHEVLDELQAVLEGEALVPYWRKYVLSIFGEPEYPAEGTGINLKKFFLEPRDFDLVLTIQGTNIEPYLAEGRLSTPESWTELTRVFGGQFFGFAIWFN